MANTLAELIVKLGADVSDYDRKLATASRRIEAFGQSFTAIGTRLAATITAPLAAIGLAAVKVGADFDSMTRGLQAVTKETGPLSTQLNRLKEVAKLPGLGFREAVQGSINLQASGFSAQFAERALKGFGNALATVGKGKTELDGVILALGQIAAKGKVSAEEINQLAERLPQIRQLMKDAFGTANTEELAKLGIEANEFIERIVVEFEKLPAVTGGVKNEFENLKDAAELALNDLAQSLLPTVEAGVKALSERVQELTKWFNQLSPEAKNTSVAIGAIAAATPLAVIGLGQLISNGGLLVAAFARLGPSIANVTVSLGSFVSTVMGRLVPGLSSASIGVQAFFATFTTAGIVAATIALEQLVSKTLSLRDARSAAEGAERQYEASLARTAIALSQQGADVSELRRQYYQGIISQDQYAAGLRKLALEIGSTKKPMEEAGTGAKKLSGTLAESAPVIQIAAEKWRGLAATLASISDSGTFRKLEQEYFDLLNTIKSEPIQIELPPDIFKQESKNEPYFTKPPEILVVPPDEAVVNWPAEVSKKMEALDHQTRRTSKTTSEFGRQVSTIMTDLSRGIAGAILKTGSLGDAFKRIGQSIVESLVRVGIEKGIATLIKSLDGLLDKLGSVGKAIGGLFGGGANAVGSAVSSAGGAISTGASSASSTGSAVASSAASGVMGAVGAIGSIGSMVSGIIGNFQMSGMNKSLDIIVQHTLQTANQLIYGIQPSLNTYLPAVSAIHDRLVQMLNQGIGVYNAAGDGGLRIAGQVSGAQQSAVSKTEITINVSGVTGSLLDQIAREASARGIRLQFA